MVETSLKIDLLAAAEAPGPTHEEDQLAAEIKVISLAPTAFEMGLSPAAYVDSRGDIWRANLELRRLAGDSEVELEGRSLLDFMAPEVAAKHLRDDLFAKTMARRVEGRPIRKEICCVGFHRSDGSVVDVDIVIALAPAGVADDLAVVYFKILGESEGSRGR